jgi:hypothetical protein
MSSDEWIEFCVNTVMGDPTCFEDSGEEEFPELEPPIGDIEPPPDIGEEELDPSPDDQELEDQGEWAINDNIKKMDSNQQKRYEGLTGYLQQLAQKIASAIDSSKSQNHRDLQTLDKNQRDRNDQLISAIKGSKSEFEDLDDTDEDKLINEMKDYWNQQGDSISQVEESLPEHKVEDYVNEGVTFSDEEITGIQTEFEKEQTEYENKIEEFVNNLPTNDIAQKFRVQMQNPNCSFSVNMMGHEIVFSFCAYGEILAMMGNWLIFISYVASIYMVLKA